MNWTRVALAAVAAGVVMVVAGFVLHGMVMAPTYTEYADVFSQEQASPAWFSLISVVLSLVVAVLYAKTRSSWPAGWRGGALLGLLVGLVVGFTSFYWPLVIAGFPYYLSWCWLGIDVIEYTIVGVVVGLVYRP
jgi:hypothetical protein